MTLIVFKLYRTANGRTVKVMDYSKSQKNHAVKVVSGGDRGTDYLVYPNGQALSMPPGFDLLILPTDVHYDHAAVEALP